jgi:hypothetical protein
MKGVLASTERRERASKGQSYQEFLIDSAAPNNSAKFSIDKDSSVGARRANFANIAKDLALDRTTVCIDDPSSFTQRAMVRLTFYWFLRMLQISARMVLIHSQVATFENLTPNVVKRHEELKKIYSHYDPDVKVNIPDATLVNLGKGLCDADSSKEGEDAVKIIFKTTLMKPDSFHGNTPKISKERDDVEVTPKISSSSAPNELLTGDRMPDIQWIFRRPPTPYTGVMQKVLESGYGTKQTMRRMLEAFQSIDADKASPSSDQKVEDPVSTKPFKILIFRGLPLPPPPQSRANLKRMLTIIQSDWDLRRKGGLIKGEESMVPVVPIPRKPTIPLKHRDRVTLAEAAASGSLKPALISLGLAISSQGALIRAGTESEMVEGSEDEIRSSDAVVPGKDKTKSPKMQKAASSIIGEANDNFKKDFEIERTLPPSSLVGNASQLFPVDSSTPLGIVSGKGLFKTAGRRPNSGFACVSRPKSALAALGSDHKDVQKLPRHVKSGAMPPRAPSRLEEDSALYWQSKENIVVIFICNIINYSRFS